jgi:hypothetical protein
MIDLEAIETRNEPRHVIDGRVSREAREILEAAVDIDALLAEVRRLRESLTGGPWEPHEPPVFHD